MLDQLQSVDDECRPRVAVDAEPPDLAQPLRVGRIAPVHRELERTAAGVGTGERRDPPLLARHGVQAGDLHPQVAHGLRHLRGRGQPVGRAHGEVAGGGGTPTDEDGPDDAERQPVSADDRAQSRQRDRTDDDAVEGTAQVREPGERHRRRDRQLQDGIARVEPGQLRHRRAAGGRSQEHVDEEADAERRHPCHRHLPHRPQPRHEQADQHEPHHHPDRPQEPQGRDQPADTRRRGVDELAEVDLEGGVGPDQGDADADQDDGDADAHGVGGAPPGRAPAVGPEHHGADTPAPGRRTAVGGQGHDAGRVGAGRPDDLHGAASPQCPDPGATPATGSIAAILSCPTSRPGDSWADEGYRADHARRGDADVASTCPARPS